MVLIRCILYTVAYLHGKTVLLVWNDLLSVGRFIINK